MIIAFVESIKYVGHLYPIAFLRIYFGYFYLNLAIEKYYGAFLNEPKLAASIQEALPLSQASDWYKSMLTIYVVPNWEIFAMSIVLIELLIAASYLVGYLVRPIGLLGFFLCLNLLFMSGSQHETLYKTYMLLHFTLAWLGAGRCLGLDYYFFKRQRGIIW